jgi:hypothetical protein
LIIPSSVLVLDVLILRRRNCAGGIAPTDRTFFKAKFERGNIFHYEPGKDTNKAYRGQIRHIVVFSMTARSYGDPYIHKSEYPCIQGLTDEIAYTPRPQQYPQLTGITTYLGANSQLDLESEGLCVRRIVPLKRRGPARPSDCNAGASRSKSMSICLSLSM